MIIYTLEIDGFERIIDSKAKNRQELKRNYNGKIIIGGKAIDPEKIMARPEPFFPFVFLFSILSFGFSLVWTSISWKLLLGSVFFGFFLAAMHHYYESEAAKKFNQS